MSATNPQEKGNALENAVHAIEMVILRTNPATKDATITIEPKKIVVVDGVKHEIDIYITIDLGHGYKSVFIFECKNTPRKPLEPEPAHAYSSPEQIPVVRVHTL